MAGNVTGWCGSISLLGPGAPGAGGWRQQQGVAKVDRGLQAPSRTTVATPEPPASTGVGCDVIAA